MDTVEFYITVWFDNGDQVISNKITDTKERTEKYLKVVENIAGLEKLVMSVGVSTVYINPTKVRAIEVTKVVDHDA